MHKYMQSGSLTGVSVGSTAAPAGREMPLSQDAKSQAMVMETIMRTLAELLNPIIQPL